MEQPGYVDVTLDQARRAPGGGRGAWPSGLPAPHAGRPPCCPPEPASAWSGAHGAAGGRLPGRRTPPPFELAQTLLGRRAPGRDARRAGTHDTKLIEAIRAHAGGAVARGGLRVRDAYGIQRGQQEKLAAAGERLRVLISYGEYWFPWYMRRLAERPANVWFGAACSAGKAR
jgi:hypothetical protein